MTIRSITLSLAAALTLVPNTHLAAQDADPQPVFAARIIEFSPGKPAASEQDNLTSGALAAIDFFGERSDNPGRVIALGCGGTLVAAFSHHAVVDSDGPDLRVHEIGNHVEPHTVDVSADLIEWHRLGTSDGGVSEFDLAAADLSGMSFKFVRVTDITTERDHCVDTRWPGSDIDGVVALNNSEAGGIITASARDKSDTVLVQRDDRHSIRAVDLDGGLFYPLRNGVPFRLAVDLAGPPREAAKVTVRWNSGWQKVPIVPSPNSMPGGGEYTSDILQLVEDNPNRLEETELGFDRGRSATLLKEHFAGTWRTTHKVGMAPDHESAALSGFARVAEDGNGISLWLSGTDEGELYTSIEESVTLQGDTDPFTASLTARFRKASRPDFSLLEGVNPIRASYAEDALEFEYPGGSDTMPISWRIEERIRVDLSTREDADYAEGAWSNETRWAHTGGGIATWNRGEIEIAGVIVVEDQLRFPERHRYPFRSDGSRVDDGLVADARTLVVYGHNLTTTANRADVQSLSPAIRYGFTFKDGADRQQIFDAAFAKAGIDDPSQYDALILKANLEPDVVPGIKFLLIDGAIVDWPLMFTDQHAIIQFVRGDAEKNPLPGGDPTSTFYSGDVGHVEMAYLTDFPFDSVSVLLRRADSNQTELAELVLTPFGEREVANGQRLFRYRSRPLHFVHTGQAHRAPPPDENALVITVINDEGIQAQIIDPAAALFIEKHPAVANTLDNPAQLGTAWKEALIRVAACGNETIGDFEVYQNKPHLSHSRYIITAFEKRQIELTKGVHAAALLIADEFVRMTKSDHLEGWYKVIKSDATIRKFRAAAASSPKPEDARFWNTEVTFFEAVQTGDINLPEMLVPKLSTALANTLDTATLSVRLGLPEAEAEQWAVQQTSAKAVEHVDRLDGAVAFATEAECDLSKLMMIAGHRIDRVIERILPRLVKLVSKVGPPKRQYWVKDSVAQAYLKSLFIVGADIRALDKYSAADTAVAEAVFSLATIGASGVLTRFVSTGSAAVVDAVSLTATAVSNIRDIYEFAESNAFAELAEGAAPVLGPEILIEAEAGKVSVAQLAGGILMSHLGTYSSVSTVRNGLNLRAANTLLQTRGEGILDDIGRLSQSDIDILRNYRHSLKAQKTLPGPDWTKPAIASHDMHLTKLDRFFASSNGGSAVGRIQTNAAETDYRVRLVAPEDAGRSHVSAGPSDASPNNTPRPPRRTGDPNFDETVSVRRGSTDPNLMDTVIDPNARQPRPPEPVSDVSDIEPDDGILPRNPGELSEHLTEAEIEELFRPGQNLRGDEIILKIDVIRDRLLKAREAAKAAALDP